LARHHNVADQSQIIAFARGVGEITGNTGSRSEDFPGDARLTAKLLLILLQHTLMLAHVRDVSRAKIPESWIVRLSLVLLERTEKRAVLHHGIVHLTLEEFATVIHGVLRCSSIRMCRRQEAKLVPEMGCAAAVKTLFFMYPNTRRSHAA